MTKGSISEIEGRTPEERLRYLEEENRRLEQKLASLSGAAKGGDAEAERNRCQSILKALPVGVFIVGPEGRILETNPAVKEIWGGVPPLSREASEYGSYQGWWADTGKPLKPEDWAAARAVQKGEDSHNEEIHILGFDGRQRTIFNSATPLYDAEGRIAGAIAVIRDITKKRRAEEALHESEARFRATFEQAAVGICHIDMEGEILRANKKLGDILGYPPEELVGRTFPEITHPDDLERDLEDFNRLLDGELTTYAMEKRYVRRDGSVMWGKLTVSLLRDKGGQPAYFISVVEDISERKKAEESLAQSERLYRSLFEHHHAVMLLIDPETGSIHDANPAACSFYGYSRTEMLEKYISEINIEAEESLRKKMKRACHQEEQSFIFQHRLASGEIRHVEVHSGPVEREGKTYLVSIVCDITERVCAERERENLLSELNATITSMAEGVVVYSPEGDILRMNPAAVRMFGLSPDVSKLPFCERQKILQVTDETGKALPSQWPPIDIYRSGKAMQGKILILNPLGGKEMRVSLSAAPIRNEKGDILGTVCTFTDITELHQLQEQNQTFLHMVSHDMRTPLTVIQGYAELLKMEREEGVSCSAPEQSLGAILQSADQMNSMITQMLDMARLESGSFSLEKEPVLLSEFLEGMLQRSASALEVARIRSHVGEVPPVSVDPKLLERILINLVTNALKYSPPRTPVEIGTSVTGEEVVLVVRDRGEGIDAADLPHLFSRYFRTRSARKKDGLGLGLYITRMMTEAHGGRIWAESAKGKGSTFYVALPLHAGHYLSAGGLENPSDSKNTGSMLFS